MSSLVMCLGMRSSQSAPQWPLSSRRQERSPVVPVEPQSETFSLMPYSAGSKSTNRFMFTIPLENTFTRVGHRCRGTASLTPHVRNHMGLLPVQHVAWHGQNLAGHGVGDGLCHHVSGKAAPDVHLLIKFIAAYLGDVVPAGIEEQRSSNLTGRFPPWAVRRDAACDRSPARISSRGLAWSPFQWWPGSWVSSPNSSLIWPSVSTPRAPDQAGNGNFAVFIDTDIKDIVGCRSRIPARRRGTESQ